MDSEFVYLASTSPRRRELLNQIGVAHRVLPVTIPECQRANEAPETFVVRTALEKARAVYAAGGPDLPVLGAEGFSGPDSRTDSYAVGMLGYTYAGATATTISLDIVLDGESGGTTDPFDAWVESNVAVILGDVNDFVIHYPTFIFEVVPGNPDLSVLGESNMSLDLNAGPQTLTGSISFTLNPGDEFFVWAGLEAGGIRDGYGDAFNTLSMSFSDAAGITPNIIPVPAAVWLFGSGLIGLIGIARRKKA